MATSLPAPVPAATVDDTDGYRHIAWLFLRLLALIYFAAFASIGIQIVGLAGADGILPLGSELDLLRQQAGAAAFWAHPSLFWIDHSDRALQAAAVAGCLCSLLLLVGRFERLSLMLAFVLYLSLLHAGQIFMNFQWDNLLLEAGFLAIFLPGGSKVVVWLFRWLLFRVRFMSGLSKLLSGDPAWSGMTALSFYFETQPLPHVGSWYAHQLPGWLLQFGSGATLFIELVVPCLMFLPRRWRLLAAWLTILWQVLILLTSNHNFFNLLTLALCLFLFDDRALDRIFSTRLIRYLRRHPVLTPSPSTRVRITGILLSALIVPASIAQGYQMVRRAQLPEPVAGVLNLVRALRIVTPYHVFPTIEQERIELEIEGSLDGETWRTYAFRYKPGDPARRPVFVVPHQPRLDWMMWFVPMNPLFLDWFHQFLSRLTVNAPAVTALLDRNPFPDAPPRMLRINAWHYRFTDPPTRARSGRWWQREYLGAFTPLPWYTPRARDPAP